MTSLDPVGENHESQQTYRRHRLAASSTFASNKWLGDRRDNWQDHIVVAKTRAPIIAKLKEACAQGLIGNGDEPNYPKQPVPESKRPREQVRSAAIETAKHPNRSLDDIGG